MDDIQRLQMMLSSNATKYFGNGSDGELNTTGNVIINVEKEDATTVVKQYKGITINKGHSLTVDKRCRGLILYSLGDVDIYGTIDMDYKSAYIDPIDTKPLMIAKKTVKKLYYPLGNEFELLGVGGYGGNGGIGGGVTNYYGGRGGRGRNGLWFGGSVGGGGGGGTAGYYKDRSSYPYNDIGYGGDGGDATTIYYSSGGSGAYIDNENETSANGEDGSDGAGGGGGAVNQRNNSIYDLHGGDGASTYIIYGDSNLQRYGAGGGGGAVSRSTYSDGNGEDGYYGIGHGGGLIVIIAKGNITIHDEGIIHANGGSGGDGGDGYCNQSSRDVDGAGGGGGGGGSGGGIIALFHEGTYQNYGTLKVNGGGGGSGGDGDMKGSIGEYGADGGIGTIKVVQL